MTMKRPTVAERPHVLLAEDDGEMRSLISRALRKEGYDVTEAADGASLVERLGDTISHRAGEPTESFDVIISDIRMPGVFGLSVLEGVQSMDGIPPIILITAFGDDETHARAEELGAAATFDKPFKIKDLMACVRGVVPPRATAG
jgi:DNA-binding response OmpR family regulator